MYIGQIYHCTEEKIDNVLTYYGITVFQEDGVSGATGKEDTTDVAQLFKIAKQLGMCTAIG